MDKRLKELLEWLQRNQSGNPYAHKDPWHPFSKWGNEGIKPVPMPKIEVDPDGVNPVPMPQMLPKDIPDWWKRGEKFPLDTGPRKEWWDKRAPYFPKEADKFPRRKFDGNKDDFLQLLKDAQVGSAMHGRGTPSYYPGNRRENMMIPPPMRKRYPAEFDPATGQNRVVPGTLRTTYPGAGRISDLPLRSATQGDSMSDHLAATYGEDSPELRRHEAQDAGIELPKGKDWITKMHDIQGAYFTGADFGYEEFWPQRLGVTNEMIDMFMAVPEEAIRHAMENPTDAVLQEFEEYYGFPLNVNDPDMQKYFGDRKKKRPRG